MITLSKASDLDVALDVEIMVHGCAWAPEACRRQQDQHGRGDDCPTHPWPTIARFPAHREGMIMNDLVTFQSLLRCNALVGHIALAVGDMIIEPDHSGCRHH